MSDNNQDKPDDLDIVIDVDTDVVSEESDDRPSHEEAEPFRDADYDDIDDGESVQDVDDNEDGIFAPEPAKKSGNKTGGLLSAVAVLAVVGAGGYVYYSNPDMIEQVKQNIAGGEIADSSVPEDVAAVAPANDMTDVAPTEEASVAAVAEVASPVSDSATSAEGAAPTEPAVSEGDLMSAEEGADAAAMAEKPVVEALEDDVVVKPSDAPTVDTQPVIPDVADADVVDVAPKAVVDSPKVSSVPAAAEAVVKSTDVSSEKSETDKPIIVESKEVQAAMSDNAKLDKYFDSPNGKILKDIPAPSMNASKGKNESIIVVNKQAKKSEKKYTSNQAISFHATDNDAKVVAASRALALQRYDAAKEMYDELYAINPRDGRVLMGRAVLFQKMGNTEDAISSYEEVLRYNPDNAEALVNLAGLIRKQYPAVALNKLLDLRQKYPDNAVVAAQLGVTYADTGNYPDAFHYLSMAASMEPNNPQHLYNMAVVAERAGDTSKAIANYEKALEVDAVSGTGGKTISRERIYDRLTRLRGN